MESQTFAEYILSEKDWIRKMEIMYYLNKRGNIFFDNSVVFKTELLKLFKNGRIDRETAIRYASNIELMIKKTNI